MKTTNKKAEKIIADIKKWENNLPTVKRQLAQELIRPVKK